MTTLSFMTANYVARQLGYRMTEGWMEGQNATDAYFRPLDTYRERFDALLAEIQKLGFQAIDLWLPHLNPAWATPEHIAIAVDLLASRQMTVVSLAGAFGDTAAELDVSCRVAVAVGAGILGGLCGLLATDRPGLLAILQAYDLRFGLENHPEKTPQALLAKVGDSAGGRIGVTLDTGWFGTHGYADPTGAIRLLADRLLHVHLKDVLRPGEHQTCRYGRGVVPVEACVRTLQEVGYTGGISIEHEPHDRNPNDDIVANLALLRGWLAEE